MMGDFTFVRTFLGNPTPEMQPAPAGGTFEVGDILSVSSNTLVKAVTNAATIAALAMSAGTSGEDADVVLLIPGIVLEGVDSSTTPAAFGDKVGVKVATGVMTFDTAPAGTGDVLHGIVTKVVDATNKIIQVTFPAALTATGI